MTTQTNTDLVRRSPLGAFLLIILLMLVSYAVIQVILAHMRQPHIPTLTPRPVTV